MRLVLVTLLLLSAAPVSAAEELRGHRVVLDDGGKLLSWLPQAEAYDGVIRRAWSFLFDKVVAEPDGRKNYLSRCCINPQTFQGDAWVHNPAGLYAMMVDSAVAYHAYSGDRRVLDLVRGMLDHQLAHGTTPRGWAWPQVPYASADPGAKTFRGAHDFLWDKKGRGGRGDGYGVIEPDKVGELGYGYLKFWQATGDRRYRDAALACADALAKHVRPGDARQSPWPFRVYAETNVEREAYTASIIGPLRLLDELMRLRLGDVAAYRRARAMAWDWIMAQPMKTNAWANYFEDVYAMPAPTNHTQINALEIARYLLEDPRRDPQWQAHVRGILAWTERTFGGDTRADGKTVERGVQWGAVTIAEQIDYMYKMGSHTSRFASVLAHLSERTGDAAAREKAFRSLNWATYMTREDGLVWVGPVEKSVWFSDGWGDYIRHFLNAMAAVPAWAPPKQDHLLRSTSVVSRATYGAGGVAYETFDADGEEVLRLAFRPKRIAVGARALAERKDLTTDGYVVEALDGGDFVVRVRRSGGRRVSIAAR